MARGEWFRIPSGEHAGRWHLAGWFLHAIKGEGFAVQGRELDNGWLSYGICPRCFAMVQVKRGSAGQGHDYTWDHEDWHAKTDYPHPEE